MSNCGLKRLGSLPPELVENSISIGTCGTFIVDNVPTIFLCFPNDQNHSNICRTLTVRKNHLLSSINDFNFGNEFKLDTIKKEASYGHIGSKLANYNGYPLAMGGWDHPKGANAQLEMFDVKQNQWMQKKQYPFAIRLNT